MVNLKDRNGRFDDRLYYPTRVNISIDFSERLKRVADIDFPGLTVTVIEVQAEDCRADGKSDWLYPNKAEFKASGPSLFLNTQSQNIFAEAVSKKLDVSKLPLQTVRDLKGREYRTQTPYEWLYNQLSYAKFDAVKSWDGKWPDMERDY